MVNTRSRFNRENRIEQSGTSRYSDDEDNMSVADHFGENVLENETENDMREIERDHENHRFEQRFLEMNRQIGELISIVKALTDRLSNSREENNRDVLNSETSARSDMDEDRGDLAEFGNKNATQIMIFLSHYMWAGNNKLTAGNIWDLLISW